jgi:hypothetical protein
MTHLLQIYSPDPTVDQLFGYSVALSDNYFVVGAPGDAMVGANTGMVYVYAYSISDNTWISGVDASFMPPMGNTGALFGSSVAIFEGSDDVSVPEASLSAWLAVGAPGRNVTGMVTVYYKAAVTTENPNPTWENLGNIAPPVSANGIKFGSAVTWYADILVSLPLNI